MEVKNFILEELKAKRSEIEALGDAIWEFAETSFQEKKSVAYFQEILQKEGFDVEMNLAGIPTAFKAVYGEGKPVVALLAEYDALPGLSQQAGVTVPAPVIENGNGHGCGHNGIAAGTFAAALVLKKYLAEAKRSGTVILFGCPGEEKGNGKTIMAREGCFDGVDAAFTWHPNDMNLLWGMPTLANVSVYFSFKGKTAHAAANPEMGRSALDAAELMNVGVNYLREHVIPEARIHYAYIDVGGIAPNVVQDHAKLHYFIRAPKAAQVNEIYQRVIKIAQGAALMTETESSHELYAGLSDYLPNKTLSHVLYDSMQEMGLAEFDDEDYQLAHKFFHETYPANVVEANKQKLLQRFGSEKGQEKIEKPLDTDLLPLNFTHQAMAGSTDVGDVSQVVPTAQFSYAPYAFGTTAHTWQVTAQMCTPMAQKTFLAAGAALARAGIHVFEDSMICEKAKEELIEQTGGKYECPIPKEIGPRLEG